MAKTKKIILILTSVLILISTIVFSCVSCANPNAGTIKMGNFLCQRDSDGLTIVSTDGTEDEDLIIPEKLDGIPVVAIADHAFEKCKVKNYIVYTNIKHIGKNAFDSDSNFKIYLIGRKDTNGMDLSENWSGIGEVIYQDFSPDIDIKGKPILKPSIKPVAPDKFIDTGDDNKNLGLDRKDVKSTTKGVQGDAISNKNINSADYFNNVNKKKIKALSKIEITSPPIKTAYIEGNIFDEKGMIVTAFYTDETTRIINVYSFSTQKLMKGISSITVTYKEKDIERTATQRIEVVAKTPTDIEVTSPPTKTTYVEGTAFDRTGLVVKVSYDNGDTANITNFNISTSTVVLGQTSVELSYTENSKIVKTTQPITVIKKVPVSLKVTKPPNKTEYIEEQFFNDTGMIVVVTYNNGKSEVVTSYTHLKNPLEIGQSYILLGYMENDEIVSCKQPITVKKKSPVSLKIISMPTKTQYIEEQVFVPNGLIIEVTYDNKTTKQLVQGFTCSTDELTYGTCSIKVNYSENNITVSIDIPITVDKKSPVKLEIISPPTKTSYTEGLKFKADGMIVRVTYDNGKIKVITNYTYNTNRLIEGMQYITLSYIENNTNVKVNQPITVGKQQAVYGKFTCEFDTCHECTGSGHVERIDKCVKCDGKGKIGSYSYTTCSSCGGSGSGMHFCAQCNGTGLTHEHYYSDGMICDYCGARGPHTHYGLNYTCSNCNGKGQYGSPTCSSCGGSGTQSYYSSTTCTNCKGKGTISSTVKCDTCIGSGKVNAHKGTYIADVTTDYNSLPADNRHTDGSWYVFRRKIED